MLFSLCIYSIFLLLWYSVTSGMWLSPLWLLCEISESWKMKYWLKGLNWTWDNTIVLYLSVLSPSVTSHNIGINCVKSKHGAARKQWATPDNLHWDDGCRWSTWCLKINCWITGSQPFVIAVTFISRLMELSLPSGLWLKTGHNLSLLFFFD